MTADPCSGCGELDSSVMVEIRGVYDGALFHLCRACGHKWHRFSEGHYLRAKADKFVNDPEWGRPK